MTHISLDFEEVELQENKKSSGFLRDIKNKASLALTPGLTLGLFSSSENDNQPLGISGGVDFSFEHYPTNWFAWKYGIGFNNLKYSFIDNNTSELAVCRTLPLSKKKNFQNSISRIKFLHECKFYKY